MNHHLTETSLTVVLQVGVLLKDVKELLVVLCSIDNKAAGHSAENIIRMALKYHVSSWQRSSCTKQIILFSESL